VSTRELPTFVAGCKMPSFHGMDVAEASRRIEAEVSNERFLEALARYFEKGGRG
jgi:hypothetical protein